MRSVTMRAHHHTITTIMSILSVQNVDKQVACRLTYLH
jgi:hypothetical protein